MFQVLHSQKNLIERSDQVPFTCTFSSSIFFPLHEPPLHAVFTLQEWRDNSLMERVIVYTQLILKTFNNIQVLTLYGFCICREVYA